MENCQRQQGLLPSGRALRLSLSVMLLFFVGCGTTRLQKGTQQLVLSDAVDRAVGEIDFSPLKGRKVFLDDQYIQQIKGIEFVNAPYIISTLRQQLAMDDCQLVEAKPDSEVIVEPRIGALGTDGHDVTYGLPPNQLLNTAASLVPNAPPIPLIPELSLAKRADLFGVAKINVFAYETKSRRPLWQSRTSLSRSTARDMWILGAGPFQSGTIYSNPMFLGKELRLSLIPDLRIGGGKEKEIKKEDIGGFLLNTEDRLPISDPASDEPDVEVTSEKGEDGEILRATISDTKSDQE